MSVSTLVGIEGIPAHRVTSAIYEGKPLGSGASRAVFAVSDGVVVKVAISESGHTDNFQEFSLWESVKDTDDSQFFTAIYAHAADWSWIAAERVTVGYGEGDWFGFRAAMDRYGIGDLWERNVGHRADGSHVALDYGWRYGDTYTDTAGRILDPRL